MVGITLGNRYELLEKIGEGGTAIVYKAKCHLLNRFVAVKVLKEEFTNDEEFVRKFKREATAAASLSCNNIVNIYDVGTEGSISYIVLEYVNGKTLNEIIKQYGRIQPEKAVNIAKQIATALNCAHSNNIIHRDIKPHNILVTAENIVKVTDFGIAKASNTATITNADKVMGSAHYLSPEQARGASVDCKTDIYSLGIVLYEMVTGKVPFDAETPISVALKHIQEPIIPPVNVNPNISPSLNSVILKATEKEPEKRYANVNELISDLDNVKYIPQTNQTLNDDYTRVMTPIKDLDEIKGAVKLNRKEDIPSEAENEDDEDEDNEDDVPESRSERNAKNKLSKKKKYIIAGTLICVLLIATLAISYIVGLGGLKNLTPATSSNVTVPSVIGETKDKAQTELKNLKLNPQFVNENSDKPVGTVVTCDPGPGSAAKAGDTIKMTVSIGPKNGTVPDVSGNDLDTATSAITQSQFVIGSKTTKHSDNVPKDYIIGTDPTAGTSLAVGGTVNLIISSGPEIPTVTVTSVIGMTLDKAQAALTGLSVNVINLQTGNKAQDNIVHDQDIAAGKAVKQGANITLTVYKYDSTQDPDVIKAAAALQNATNAVTAAEKSKAQADIDSAKTLVNALPDGTDKTNLLNRLNAITPVSSNTSVNNTPTK